MKNFKLIAFYLPQFHPLYENDKFWGEGFTEWKFVVKARPLFRFHYQPRIPSELGFYDLRLSEILEYQVNLAREYGIDAFCFYFYWFNGQRLLYKPIENFVKNKDLRLEYCLCWANENWTRRWDGEEHYLLLRQEYNIEDMKRLIREFIEHFKDERYLKYKNKPVLLIYRPTDIPMWKEISYLWREECLKAGIGEIHIAGVYGVKGALLNIYPRTYGLDSFVIFPPHGYSLKDSKELVVDLNKSFTGTIYDYDTVIENDLNKFFYGYEFPFHRGLMLHWDNTPRVNLSSRIFIGFTPLRFAYWLRNLLKQELFWNTNDESLIFINAWNEWGEGTYLEPDERYGRTVLRLVRLVREEVEKIIHENKVSNYNKGLVKNQSRYIEKLRIPNRYKVIYGNKKYEENKFNLLLVSHVSGERLFGGERSFLDLIRIFQEIGCLNLYVALMNEKNQTYINEIIKNVCAIFIIDYKQWINGRCIEPAIYLQFADIITKYNIDIIYCNTIVLLEPSIAAVNLKRLSITHVREIISEDPYLSYEIGYSPREIKDLLYRRSQVLICNSNSTLNEYKDFNNVYYLPNLVDIDLHEHSELSSYLNSEEKSKVILGMLSSNIPKKGLLNMLELIEYLKKEYSEKIEVWIVGPRNSFVEHIENKLTNQEIKFVKFIDYVDNPIEILRNIDILLSMSDFAESFGRTVAEALALKKPVIAFNKGALRELVIHEENGFLVEYKDIRKIFEYCKKLIDDPELRCKMGEKGPEVIKKYSFENVLNICKKITDDLINKFLSQTNKIISNEKISIIIPVYNAPDELELCLNYLFKYTKLDEHTELIIIDDCSIHPKVDKVLKMYENISNVRILKNKKNLGYTKTVNRGIKEAEGRDIVLLNSDTIPTPFWLEGLRSIAYLEKKIGTVTAMSDNAGAFSFPDPYKPNPKPNKISYEEYALRIIQNCLDLGPVEVPTGNGFCMYIKRELINEIGYFDEVAFPIGYGEENDFCMRALLKGWQNVISPWSFVYHIRSASFGSEREKLVRDGLKILLSRYPDYKELVEKYFNSKQILKLRERVRNVRNFYKLYEEMVD